MIKNNLLTKILITLGLTFSVSTFVNADRTANGVPGDGVIGQVLQSLGGGVSIWTATSSLGISGGSGSGNSAWTIGSGLIYNATSTDKVGIGTSTPAYPLTVVGTSSLPTIISSKINGTIVVDGIKYPQTGAGIQSAINDCASVGGGTVFLPTGQYSVLTTITFPYESHCALVGTGLARSNSGGTELRANAQMDSLISISGAPYATANVDLAHDNRFLNLYLNGNNKASTTLLLTNTDTVILDYVRLTGSDTNIKTVYTGIQPPSAGSKPGGLFIDHSILGATASGTNIYLDSQTQVWIANTWFESGVDQSYNIIMNESNKIHITNVEFNSATTSVLLLDTATTSTQDITITSSVFNPSSSSGYAINDQRTNTSSGRISLDGNTYVRGSTTNILNGGQIISQPFTSLSGKNIGIVPGGFANVGIGTTSPSYTLEIMENSPVLALTDYPGYFHGGADPAGRFIFQNITDELRMFRGTLGVAATEIHRYTEDRDISRVLSVQSTNSGVFNGIDLAYFSSSSTIPGFINFFGLFGIGTTTPKSKLSISASTTESSDLFDVSSSTGVTLFKILSNGNIGIGTTTPSQSLTVAGNQYLTGAFFDSTNASGTLGMVLQTTGTTTRWVATSSLGISSGGGSGTVTSVSLNTPTGLTASSSTCTTACVLGISLTGGYVIPLTASTSQYDYFVNNPVWRIGNGFLYNATSSNKISIGTSTSLSKLYVSDDSTNPSAEVGSFVITSTSSSKRMNFGVNTLSTMYSYIQSVENGIATRNLSLNPIGGNVGIGTTTPVGILSIGSGRIVIPRNSSINYDGSNNDTVSTLFDGSAFRINNGGFNSRFDSSGSSARFTIGRDNVSANGTVNVQGNLMVGSSTSYYVEPPTNGAIIEGIVGIGTSTPTQTLTVSGTSSLRDTIPETTNTYSLGASTTRWASLWSGIVNIGTSTWSLGQIGTRFGIFPQAQLGGTEAFSILSDGKVGIGSTTPSDLLTVQGSINVTGSYKVNGVAISSSADGVGTSTADYIISKNGSNVVVYDTTANTNTSYSDFDDAMNAIIPTATSTGRSNVVVRSGIYAINSSILYPGNGTVYSTSLNLTGAGGTSTLLVINTPKGFDFSQRAKVNFSNLGIAVGANTNTAFYASTTSGVMASIMDSSFSDIIAVSTTTGHTGYVFNFIGDFRNNYENIRAYQVGNLWRSQNNYSNAQFINGDSNWYGFNFCEINNSSTTASGVCWELKGNNGQVNQVIFGDINGISNDSGASSNDVFLKLTNATRISMPSGGNAEQFATTTQVVSGNGIFLAFTKYVTQTTSATGKAFLDTSSTAYNVNVQCKEVELSAATIVWSDKNTLAGQSNRLSGINGGNCIMTDNGGSVVWATSTRSSIEGIYNNIDGSTSLAAWKVLGDKIVSNFSGSMNNFLSDVGSALRIFRGGVEKFTFTDSGSLGVGSSTPNYKLSVVGTVGINGLTTSTAGNAICILASNEVVTAGGTTCVTSSAKTKNTITTLKTAKEIMKLRPVSYVNNEGGDTRYGLIAEEAAKVDPILVEYAKSDLRFASSSGSIKKGEPLTVDYQRSLITKMLKFVQDLYTTVQNLSNRTSNVELRLEKLEAENRSLLKRIDDLEKNK